VLDERHLNPLIQEHDEVGPILEELAASPSWFRMNDLIWALYTVAATEVPASVTAALVRRAQELLRSRRLVDEPATRTHQQATAMLGHALARTTACIGPGARHRATGAVLDGAALSVNDQHALALLALSAGALMHDRPDAVEARTVLRHAASRLHLPRLADPWLWPEPERDALDGAIPNALIVAGTRLDDSGMVRNGLLLLDWRLAYALDAADGEQVLTEAHFLLEACRDATRITGDPAWERRGREWAMMAVAGALVPDIGAQAELDLRASSILRRDLVVSEVLRAPVATISRPCLHVASSR
jgi:hypothetical protein